MKVAAVAEALAVAELEAVKAAKRVAKLKVAQEAKQLANEAVADEAVETDTNAKDAVRKFAEQAKADANVAKAKAKS